MHLQGLGEDRLPIPESDAFAEYMARLIGEQRNKRKTVFTILPVS